MIWKPPTPAAINYGHPLARGLIACVLCNEMGGPLVDMVSGNTIPIVGSGVRAVSNMGASLECLAANDSGARATAWSALKVPSTEVSVLWRGRVATAASAFAGLFGVSFSGSAPFSCFQFDLGSTGALIRFVFNNAGTQANMSGTPSPAYDDSERQYVGIVRSASQTSQLWENLRIAASSSSISTFSPTYSASSGIEVGTLRSGAGVNSKSIFRHGYIWQRALTAAEVKWLYEEPYAFIRPRARQVGPANAVVSSAVFRRSLSNLGTRVGSRQVA
jgi:hypothetical protein